MGGLPRAAVYIMRRKPGASAESTVSNGGGDEAMEITEVKVFPVHEDKLKAFVSVVFDHCFMVNDIKIIQGRDGLFISMPSRKKKNGEFKDVAHPLNNETRRVIETRVLGEYERVLAERGERPAEGVQRRGDEEPAEAPPAALQPPPEKSLEEIQELHLRDSFWTIT